MSLEIAANPALEFDRAALKGAAAAAGLDDHVLFRTSGSGSPARWAALSHAALDASARSVNRRLETAEQDVWLLSLPDFHVGGHAIWRRAELAGARVEPINITSKWCPESFVEIAGRCGGTLASLVPTQIYDLVTAKLRAPESMRRILVGGACLEGELRLQAESLGWPVCESYGMTEAGSTIAIDGQPLEDWQLRTDSSGELLLRGPALFDGYLAEGQGGWEFRRPLDAEGWFATGDQVALAGDKLQFGGRLANRLKVLGETVDLDALQSVVERIGGPGFALVGRADERSGHRLLLIGEAQDGDDVLKSYNAAVPGYERASEYIQVERLPRSSLGKLLRPELDQMLEKSSEA